VAITPGAFHNGAVGFIDWLDLFTGMPLALKECRQSRNWSL